MRWSETATVRSNTSYGVSPPLWGEWRHQVPVMRCQPLAVNIKRNRDDRTIERAMARQMEQPLGQKRAVPEVDVVE